MNDNWFKFSEHKPDSYHSVLILSPTGDGDFDSFVACCFEGENFWCICVYDTPPREINDRGLFIKIERPVQEGDLWQPIIWPDEENEDA